MRNVAADPLQSRDLVEQTIITRRVLRRLRGERRMREKSERSQSVIERDDNRALLCEARAVMPLLTTKPGEEPATVNPDHDRPARCAPAQGCGPHVEGEPILG